MKKALCVLVFAKPPMAGKVKTRLQRVLGRRAAVFIYKYLLETTLKNISGFTCDKEMWCPNNLSHPVLRRLSAKYTLPVFRQKQGTIGDMMFHATRLRLKTYRYVILIGSDCPTLDEQYLQQAVLSLEQGSDVVLGPSNDGGYVLIALKKVEHRLFQGIHWSSESVMRETIRNARRIGYACKILAPQNDIDTIVDWKRMQKS